MRLTPEQLMNWWQIVMRSHFNNPSYTVDTKRPMSKQEIASMRQAINELLTAGVGSYQLDEELRAAGLPDTDAMEEMLRRKEKAIIRRGSIRNDEEYDIANEALNSGINDLSKKAAAALATMIDEYQRRMSANTSPRSNAGILPPPDDSPASGAPSTPEPRG